MRLPPIYFVTSPTKKFVIPTPCVIPSMIRLSKKFVCFANFLILSVKYFLKQASMYPLLYDHLYTTWATLSHLILSELHFQTPCATQQFTSAVLYRPHR